MIMVQDNEGGKYDNWVGHHIMMRTYDKDAYMDCKLIMWFYLSTDRLCTVLGDIQISHE